MVAKKIKEQELEEEVLDYEDMENDIAIGKDEELVTGEVEDSNGKEYDSEEVSCEKPCPTHLVMFNINVKYGDDLFKIGDTANISCEEAEYLQLHDIVKIL